MDETLRFPRVGAERFLREITIAARAYSRYLLLRHNPEPSIKPAVNSVRVELARPVGEQQE
jgi:hypothetical protein